MKPKKVPEQPYAPLGKCVLVFRLPSELQSKGGIYIATEASAAPRSCGVLVAAGLAARDVLADNLIEIGDTVYFGRFEGWEQEFAREKEGKGEYLLQMKVDG